MAELTDVPGAFGYGESILVGERCGCAACARRPADAGAMGDGPRAEATLSNWVVPPSEAAAKERIAKWSANQKDDLGFAIETLDDPPVLVGNLGLWGARPKDRCGDDRDRARPRVHRPRVRQRRDAHHRRLRVPRDGPAPHRARRGALQPRRIRAYEKAGLMEEGRHREAVLHDGRWYDEVLMSVFDPNGTPASRLAGKPAEGPAFSPAGA